MRFEFIQAEKDNFPLWLLCRAMSVSRKGYHSWQSRGSTSKNDGSATLDQAVREVHREHKRRYGSRRVKAELDKKGIKAGRTAVRQSMRRQNLKVRYPKPFRKTTVSDPNAAFAPNILDRNFACEAPNTAWVGDISYVNTSGGFLYLAVVIDLHSRMVVGWSVQSHMRAELVDDALRMAVGRRDSRPRVFHSDRGSQYTSSKFSETCGEFGIVQSMSRKGNCWDNAVSESFFSAIDRELLSDGRSWSPERSRLEIFTYIETYYNRRRLHSTLGYQSPADFEKQASTIAELARSA